MITQTINLNMTPGVITPRIWASQNDSGTRAFQFNLFNGAQTYSPAASDSVLMNGIKPDGTAFSAACSHSGYVVTADCTAQMTAVVGDVECEIRIVDPNANTIGTVNFILSVEVDPQELATVSENELAALAVLTAQGAANAAAAASAASEAVSSAQALSGAITRVNTLEVQVADIRTILYEMVITRETRLESIIVNANATGHMNFPLTYAGYTPVALQTVAVTGTGAPYANIYNANINGNDGNMYYKNMSDSDIMINVVMRATYVRDEVYGGLVT